MAVEGNYSQLIGVAGEEDTWNIAVSVEGHLNLTGNLTLDVESVNGDFRVGFTCLGIFVGIGSRIALERTIVRCHTGIKGETEHRHFAFIPSDVSQHLAVGAEFQGTVHGEFFLIDPVGDAIEHLVAFAIFSDLTLAVAVEQLYEEDVVVSHKSYHVAIR